MEELATEVIRLLSRVQKNVGIIKKACTEVEKSRYVAHAAEKKVIELQNELIDQSRNQTVEMKAAIKQSVETGMRGYSDVLKNNVGDTTIRNIKTAVKDVTRRTAQEPDRSRNVIIFGVDESIGEEYLVQCSENIFSEIRLKPKLESAVRIGTFSVGKMRPVKVTLLTTASVSEILKNSKNLKSSSDYSSVFISPDRNEEQRDIHKKP